MFHAHTVLCSLCTLIPGSLAHATVVKYGGVNKSNGLDLLSASEQLNRVPQGNEVQAAIMGNMEMGVFYKVNKHWESIVVWNLQERFIYRYSQCNHWKKTTHAHDGVWATLQVCKTSKSDLPVIHPCSCWAISQDVWKLRVFSQPGGEFWIPTWEKDAWTCEWNRRNPSRCYCRQLSSTNANDVYIFRLTFCVADTSEKFPGVIFPVRLQTSTSLEEDPRSRRSRESVSERRWLFSGWSYGTGPVNRVPQLVCKSPILTYLKYHSLEAVKETPHSRPLFPVSIPC